MTTRRLREAIRVLRSNDYQGLAKNAEAELEAICRAAAVLDAEHHGHAYNETDMAEAFLLIEALAKEAK